MLQQTAHGHGSVARKYQNRLQNLLPNKAGAIARPVLPPSAAKNSDQKARSGSVKPRTGKPEQAGGLGSPNSESSDRQQVHPPAPEPRAALTHRAPLRQGRQGRALRSAGPPRHPSCVEGNPPRPRSCGSAGRGGRAEPQQARRRGNPVPGPRRGVQRSGR